MNTTTPTRVSVDDVRRLIEDAYRDVVDDIAMDDAFDMLDDPEMREAMLRLRSGYEAAYYVLNGSAARLREIADNTARRYANV